MELTKSQETLQSTPCFTKKNKMEKHKYIDVEKRYILPANLSVVRYKGKILLIAVDTATWLVLENEEQLRFFSLLQKYSIRESMVIFQGKKEDVINTITQIEARKFDELECRSAVVGTLHFYLTNKCNMKCPHCYMNAGKCLDDELTTEEVKDVLKEYAEYGGENVVFSGGEATTRKDIVEILQSAKEYGFHVSLLSNGYGLSDIMIEKISELVDRLQISIDGYSEKENSKVRRKGSFQNVLDSLDKFLKNGVSVELAITPWLDEELEKKVGDYADFGKNLNNKYADYKLKIKYTTGLLDGRDLHLSKDERQRYSKIMQEVTNLYYGKDVSNDSFISSHRRKLIFNNCSYGNITIGPNGDVYPCTRITSIKPYANVRRCTFDYVHKMSEKIQRLSDVKNLKPCNECPLMNICGGNCRIKYFPFFKFVDNFENVKIPIARECNQSIKNEFYELMINTNKKIFI